MVKRWAVVGLIGIIVVFLVGCIGRTVNQVTTPLKTDFSLKTTMSYQDWETEGILSKTTIKEKGEQYVIQGNTENGEYKLVVEQKTGLPVSLELKAMDLQCTFEPIEDTTSQSVFLSSVA